jgi:hypothetical protein
VLKHESKTPLGKHRGRLEDNIQVDLQEVEFGGTEWIELDQDTDRWQEHVNVLMNYRVT